MIIFKGRIKLMKKLKLKAPAKINLALEIKNKRPDAYHNLVSIMQTVSLFDKIKIKKSKMLKCCCNNKNIPLNNQNLAMKAAIEFFKHNKINQNVKIKIFKKIPTQAGLGGGSSNAATVLIGLNKMFETKLSKQELCKIAAKIGADVPFFIYGKTALVSGMGELVKPLKPISQRNILIIKPKNLNINTKQAFLEHDLIKTKPSKQHIIENITKKIENKEPFYSYCNNLFNSFENTLNNNQIKKIKLKLKNAGAIVTLMTGSGSSIFSVFKTLKLAKKASKQFSKNKFFKFICKTI